MLFFKSFYKKSHPNFKRDFKKSANTTNYKPISGKETNNTYKNIILNMYNLQTIQNYTITTVAKNVLKVPVYLIK